MTDGRQVALTIAPMRELRGDMLRELEHSRQLFTEQLRRVEDVMAL